MSLRRHENVAVALLATVAVLCFAFGTAAAQGYPPNGQIPLTGACAQSVEQMYMSGSFNKIVLAFEYHAFAMLHDLGAYDLCTMAPASHYCTTYFRMMCVRDDGSEEEVVDGNLCSSSPVIGMCVPQSCSSEMLSGEVSNYTRSMALFQGVFGFGGACTRVPYYCTNRSYGYMSAVCIDERKSFTSDPAAVGVFSVIVVLCSMSLLCAAIGIYRRWSSTGGDSEKEGESAQLLSKADRGYEIVQVNTTEEQNGGSDRSSKLWEFVGWFDLVENARDFFTVKSRNVSQVDTRYFEGVRTIAMLFVLFGHSLYFPSIFGFYNAKEPTVYLRSYASIGVFPAELAVDTFFFLSGFLMFHLYLKYSEKRAGADGTLQHPPVSHIPMMYLRRYLRMTPVVMLTLVFAVWLSIYIPDGVLREAYSNQAMLQTCKEFWWHQVLYITNLHDAADWAMCMGWFWYLSTDFQLFIAAPFLVAPYFVDRRLFFALMASIILVITGVQAKKDFGSFLGGDSTNYDKPWMRCNPYIFGLVCAALVRVPKVRSVFAERSARWISFISGTILMVTSINVMWVGMKCYEEFLNTNTSTCPTNYYSFMNSYAVSAWGLGMSFVALPWALSKEMGPIKWFLSTTPFAIASKLTFCCYMLHPIIIMIMTADGARTPVFTPLMQYSRFAAATLLTFTSATLLHLVVEVPFAKMNDALTRTS